ncbi:MAG: radical SAM protein [Candidatus Hodarchaeales archaeon]|jgi:radical SAM superfamily enzyme with C-terminal helix-hairpin-helix motif
MDLDELAEKDYIVILDGYTDEPSILGVPPYIAPLPRYVHGALQELDKQAKYFTIDQARTSPEVRNILANAGMLIIIAGALLPGKYIRGLPISYKEITYYAKLCPFTVLGGSVARFGYYDKGAVKGIYYPPEYFEPHFSELISGDLDTAVHDFFKKGQFTNRHRTTEELSRWSARGATIARQHPDTASGYTMADLELFKGCIRYFTGGCSFCIEPAFGKPAFRSQEDVATEVKALCEAGVKNFRLGGASCIFSYKTIELGHSETPLPNVSEIIKLLEKINVACPDLKVLHTDNANPAIIANNPNESREILRALMKYCTGGNILSFGLESVDPRVRQENNLNATTEQCYQAIKLVNEIGSQRSPTGVPNLLPGINLVYGLVGETKKTYDDNYRFLKRILDENLLLRRINLRQVLNFRNKSKIKSKQLKRFHGHKQRVLDEIENPMLERLLPLGTVLRDLFVEIFKMNVTYARQAGTYPIMVKIPETLSSSRTYDAIVTGHNKKSVNALTLPVRINNISVSALRFLPGMGSKRANKLHQARPFTSIDEVEKALDTKLDFLDWIAPHLDFAN